MKVFRFVLVLAFMFTLVVSPVQAQAAASYGFVPLLTKVNAAIPLREQARQAFEILRPKLLAAQKNGSILEFSPEFEAGIVKIKYAAGVKKLQLGTAQVFNNIHAAVAAVPHKQVATANPEVFSPVFYPSLYSSCFSASGLGTNTYLIGNLRDKADVLITNYAGYADVNGDIYDCLYWAGSYSTILPGYKLTFQVYSTAGGTLLGTYSVIAPNIAFSAINKANSVVSGIAPAGRAYSAYWYHRYLNAANTGLSVTKTGTVAANSQWSVDFGTTPFRGYDYVDIAITQTARFIFDLSMDVPSIYCELGSNYCEVNGFPLQAASLTIAHAAVPTTFTGTFSKWGWFSAELEDSSGFPIFLVPGDAVSGTSIPAYTLPNLTAVGYFATDTVRGKAPVNRYFYVYVRDVYNDTYYYQWTHSDAAGNYIADFHSQFDLKATDVLSYTIYYTDPVTGNRVNRYIATTP